MKRVCLAQLKENADDALQEIANHASGHVHITEDMILKCKHCGATKPLIKSGDIDVALFDAIWLGRGFAYGHLECEPSGPAGSPSDTTVQPG